jgi:hypothetical protein
MEQATMLSEMMPSSLIQIDPNSAARARLVSTSLSLLSLLAVVIVVVTGITPVMRSG